MSHRAVFGFAGAAIADARRSANLSVRGRMARHPCADSEMKA